MAFGLKISDATGDFVLATTQIGQRIAVAATLAVRDAAETAKQEGRANIASAGFGPKWQNALQDSFYPSGNKSSIDAAALVFHKIPYSSEFETGARIVGNPRLWLPLPNVPTRTGGHRMTPAQYISSIGSLVSVNRPGKPPLLMGLVPESQVNRQIIKVGKPVSSRRTFAKKSSRLVRVPMFVGIAAVDIKKKFDIVAIVQRAAARLGEFYIRHIDAG